MKSNNWKSFLPKQYTARGRILKLLDHLDQFMLDTQLYPSTSKSFIAVSAGVDSVFLAYCLSMLFKKKNVATKLHIIHFNHGTRKECEIEEYFVSELAKRLELSFSSIKFNLRLNENNFEQNARDLRYKELAKISKNIHSVYLGHHIDDSYEWSLMQKSRSGNLISTLGIPLKNKNYRRPLHCLTKSQIMSFVKDLDLKFIEDSSNQNNKYERNFLRNNIINSLEKRYPKLLRHYVTQANELANILDLSAYRISEKPLCFVDKLGGVNLLQLHGAGNFFGQGLFLKSVIQKYFPNARGNLQNTIDQIIMAQSSGKNGPHYLTNDLQVFYYHGIIQVLDKATRLKYKNWDNCLDLNLDKHFSNVDNFLEGPGPFWTVSKNLKDKRLMPSLNRPHPLFPNLFKQVKLNGFYIRPYSQLLIKAQKKELTQWKDDYISLV